MDGQVGGCHDFPGMSGGGEVVMGGRLGGPWQHHKGVSVRFLE